MKEEELEMIMWDNDIDRIGRPIGRLTRMEIGSVAYTILPEKPIAERYNAGTLSKTRFAVYKGNERVSKWFINYGNAIRKLRKFARILTEQKEVQHG